MTRMAKGRILKHRLYDAASGRFFVRNGEWTKDESAASTFNDVASAIQLCLRYGLKDAQLQVRTGSGRRIRVPICA
jgi:hypothetical protein